MDDGRRRHYGAFYGIESLSEDPQPLLVVHGNCQAESIRVLLAGPIEQTGNPAGDDRRTGQFRAVRIPPVHELVPSDLPHLRSLLARTDVLLSHPIRPAYRGLPIGTQDCAQLLPARARLLRFPIVRYLGLHPYQAIVRPPGDPSAAPDPIPYHDLRTLTAVRDRAALSVVIDRTLAVQAPAAALRMVGQRSLEELARREEMCDVQISDRIPDLLSELGTELMHTINHPGNAVLMALAQRLQAAIGVGPGQADQIGQIGQTGLADPGRVLLGRVRAPLEPAVLAALGLPSAPRPSWQFEGDQLEVADVVRAQAEWYRHHPGVIEAGLTRHAGRISLLGL